MKSTCLKSSGQLEDNLIHPKIEITFWNDKDKKYFTVCRNMKDYLEADPSKSLSGYSYELHGKKKNNKVDLTKDEISSLMDKIEFVYIESINTFIPELIDNIADGIINVEYDRARFSQSKKELKDAYETYIDGLNSILEVFANTISGTFRRFKEEWKVHFIVPKNSDSFRDLISENVNLSLDDNGSVGILDKGAGLQRLATILLNFEMLARINRKKSIIICIDEPDVYLHEGLQLKLKELFDEKSSQMQILFTTHSKVFINEYNMRNVFLLDSNQHSQYSARQKKDVQVTETVMININDQSGYDRICSHLGIEAVKYELLRKNNLLVEGACDKKYLTELFNYFSLPCPNIEALNGADNALKYLEFYNSYYRNNTADFKPKVKVLLDNDNKGREVYLKIKNETYTYIDVTKILLQNHCNCGEIRTENNNTNNEIEDFLYPDIVVYLINLLLEKKNMNKLNVKSVCNKIHRAAFSEKGILSLCEYEKNNNNPDNGAELSFVSSGKTTNNIKEGLAGMFNLKANKYLLSLMGSCDKRYPAVREILENLSYFDDGI